MKHVCMSLWLTDHYSRRLVYVPNDPSVLRTTYVHDDTKVAANPLIVASVLTASNNTINK